MRKTLLKYDKNIWEESSPEPVNTLQFFITNKCNLRCKACFYKHNLGKGDISPSEYANYLSKYVGHIKKVVLLGGEPTLYENLKEIIKLNQSVGVKTTIYTNGVNLKPLEKLNLKDVKVRVGVYGSYSSEKALDKISRTKVPLTVVYMLRKDNVKELAETAKMAEKEFKCKDFYISSIRDIAETHSFWDDNEETLSLKGYIGVVQEFIDNYEGNLNLHIALRGVFNNKAAAVNTCRFGNIFPDGKKIRCPLDISLKKYCKDIEYGQHVCDKDKLCILRKMVLKKKK